LLRRAEAAGAEVREGVRVRSVGAGRESARVEAGGEAFEGRAVVGAGGHTCPVARALGGVSERESVVLTQESETLIGEERLRAIAPHYGLPELFAEPDFKGYSWYFTKGGFLNVGVGCIGKRPSVHERLEALLARLRASGRLPGDLELTPFKGHAYSIRRRSVRRVAGERFLLVGDAAGLARDFSGEGIGPAVWSACLAAEALGDWLAGRAGLDAYARRIEALYGSGREGWADRVADLLPEGMVRAVAKAVCGNAWLRRRLVLEGAFGIG
jgi:flavin-dependent dehydrogenase